MRLEEHDIREFVQLWQEEFHEEIPLAEARYHASQLLELYALLTGLPATEEEQPSSSSSETTKP